MKDIYLLVKKYFKIVIAIIIFIAICIPFVLAYLYLRQQGKKIQIHPEFKIIDCKKEDVDALTDVIDIAKDILNRVQE